MTEALSISPLGDNGIRIEFGLEVSMQVNDRVHSFAASIQQHPFKGFVELVPAYTSVTIYYNPLLIRYEIVKEYLINRLKRNDGKSHQHHRVITLPVYYGKEAGPDLRYVSEYHRCSEEKVIEWHSNSSYHVYMIGFQPGFPYLGGMLPSLVTPRKREPRKYVAAGSVGIAGAQTGVYPLDSPGGWQIIGKTPVKLFDLRNDMPFLIKAGDKIRFKPIDKEEFEYIQQNVESGTFKPKITRGGGKKWGKR